MDVRVKRIYEPPAPDDGRRVLVDRLWPRGISKEAARLDAWLRDVAPSAELCRWFAHDPGRWEEFRTCYLRELEAPERADALSELLRWAEEGRLTLLFATRDPDRNNAVVLREHILQGGSGGD